MDRRGEGWVDLPGGEGEWVTQGEGWVDHPGGGGEWVTQAGSEEITEGWGGGTTQVGGGWIAQRRDQPERQARSFSFVL